MAFLAFNYFFVPYPQTLKKRERLFLLTKFSFFCCLLKHAQLLLYRD